MRRGLLALVAALAALVAIVAAGPASGTDYRAYPPKLDLYKEGPADRAVFLQHTRPQAFAWHTYSRKTGRWSLTQGSGVMGWPVADKVGAKKIVFFRMDSRHAPTTVEIKSYNNPDMRGKPIYLKPGWVAVTNVGISSSSSKSLTGSTTLPCTFTGSIGPAIMIRTVGQRHTLT